LHTGEAKEGQDRHILPRIYNCQALQTACIAAQIGMSAHGQATENARAESFLKTVKYEEVNVHRYHTFEEAQAHLQTFLEEVYNAKRLHSSLDYVPPDEFEVNYLRCSWSDGMDSLGTFHANAVNVAVKGVSGSGVDNMNPLFWPFRYERLWRRRTS
jgi:Integrase core domain